MSWHVGDTVIERYATGRLDAANAFSVEAHLLDCADCRARTAPLADAARLEAVWAGVQELVDTPKVSPVEHVLLHVGVREHVARLLAATPSLTLSWLSAVALCLGFAVVAAHESERGAAVFLALAPLLPLAGVAAAYGPWLDPTYEIGLAAPMRAFKLLFLRSGCVLATTTMLTSAAAFALPHLDWRAATWLLPSLALVLASLVLATYMAAAWAFGAVAACWIGTVIVLRVGSGTAYLPFDAPAQAAFAAAAAAAAVLLAHRFRTYDLEREA